MSLPLMAFLAILGCSSSEPTPATKPSTSPKPTLSLAEELRMQKCPIGSLQGTATAEDYDQALDIAITKIAAQIQSSVTANR